MDTQVLKPRSSAKQFFWEIVQVIAVSAVIVFVIRAYIFQPFIVRGSSMQPTYYEREYLIINKIGYRFHDIARGDVVVFKSPQLHEYLIKRVIALPGERVVIQGGVVSVYPKLDEAPMVLDEGAYLSADTITAGDVDTVVAEGEYFVMGDNRGASYDSRYIGPIPRDEISGKVWLRLFPFDRVGSIHTPDYAK